MPDGLMAAPRSHPASTLQFLEVVTGVLSRQFGAPFRVIDLESLEPVAAPATSELEAGWVGGVADLVRSVAEERRVAVRPISELLQALVIPLVDGREPGFAAIGYFATRPWAGAQDTAEITRYLGPDYPADRLHFCQPELLVRLGEVALASIADARQLRSSADDIKQMASQVSRNYEEITLLYQLTREAQVSHGTRAVQDLTLSLLAEVLPAQQIAYVSARDDVVLYRGDMVLDLDACRGLTSRFRDGSLRRPLVENHIAGLDWAQTHKRLERLIIVPIMEADNQFGWLLAVNTVDGSELGSVEASLMVAVAAILATHEVHVKLFQNIEELFLGVVRALSSAIDAKDPYTCGHSDRVARVASRIGQELGLGEDETNLLYLSGLLHDVGKIGIRDAVLLKPGQLTAEEFEHIKEHPTIGYDILSGVRQLKSVLPGVRNHHERIDGTGYPDGLTGLDIPLMARILAVADAYDAMSSDRPYRKGMGASQIDEIFRNGAGRQWDSRVVAAFLAVRGDIPRLTSIRSTAPAATLPHDARPFGTENALDANDLRRISKLLTLVVG